MAPPYMLPGAHNFPGVLQAVSQPGLRVPREQGRRCGRQLFGKSRGFLPRTSCPSAPTQMASRTFPGTSRAVPEETERSKRGWVQDTELEVEVKAQESTPFPPPIPFSGLRRGHHGAQGEGPASCARACRCCPLRYSLRASVCKAGWWLLWAEGA